MNTGQPRSAAAQGGGQQVCHRWMFLLEGSGVRRRCVVAWRRSMHVDRSGRLRSGCSSRRRCPQSWQRRRACMALSRALSWAGDGDAGRAGEVEPVEPGPALPVAPHQQRVRLLAAGTHPHRAELAAGGQPGGCHRNLNTGVPCRSQPRACLPFHKVIQRDAAGCRLAWSISAAAIRSPPAAACGRPRRAGRGRRALRRSRCRRSSW